MEGVQEVRDPGLGTPLPACTQCLCPFFSGTEKLTNSEHHPNLAQEHRHYCKAEASRRTVPATPAGKALLCVRPTVSPREATILTSRDLLPVSSPQSCPHTACSCRSRALICAPLVSRHFPPMCLRHLLWPDAAGHALRAGFNAELHSLCVLCMDTRVQGRCSHGPDPSGEPTEGLSLVCEAL